MANVISRVGKRRTTVRRPPIEEAISPHVAEPVRPAVTPGATPGIPPVAAPVAPPKPPAYAGDSTYFRRLAGINAQTAPQLAQLDDDEARDEVNTQNFLIQLAKNSLDSQSRSMAGAAKMGLANSGYNEKGVADIVTETGRQSSEAINAREARRTGRVNTRAAIIAQQENEAGTAYSEGEQRWLDAQTPTGASAKVNTGANSTEYPFKNTKTGEVYKVQTIRGKKVHVYPDGRKVVVG